MTTGTREKADRLRAEGRVRKLDGAHVFGVDGDHATYLVVIHEVFEWCSCPATRECSHMQAARDAFASEAGTTARDGRSMTHGARREPLS